MNKTHQLRTLATTFLAIALGSSLFLTACKQEQTTTTEKTTTTTSTSSPDAGTTSKTNTPPEDKGKNTNTPLTAAMGGDKQGSDPISFLLDDQVKKEVNFTDEQTAALKKVRDDLRDNISNKFKTMGLEKLDTEGKKAKIKESGKDIQAEFESTKAKVDNIIKPEQAKRLTEIALQRYGWGPLTTELPGVSSALKLTDKQKTDLRTIAEQMQTKNQTGWELPTGDDANRTKILNDNRKRMEAILKDVNEQSLAVLTPEQKTALEKLKGKPFTYVTPAPGTPATN